MDIPYPHMAWLRQNTLLIVHRLGKRTRLIERIEQFTESSAA